MLIFRNIIVVLLLLTLAAISVVGIMVEFPSILSYTPSRINELGRSVLAVMRPGYLLFVTWIIIFLGSLLVFFITVARPRRRVKIEVQMGGGRVVIMDAAIKKYIRNALAEIGEVTVKKIDLREHRNLVTTDITADVRTRENLPTLERRIISRVRAALAEDLGITNLGDVHVFIRNFEVTGRPIQQEPVRAGKQERGAVAAATTAAAVSEPAAVSEREAVGSQADIAEVEGGAVESELAYEPVVPSVDSLPAKEESDEGVVFTDSGLMTTESAEDAHELRRGVDVADDGPLNFESEAAADPDVDGEAEMPWLKPDAIEKRDSKDSSEA